MTISKKTRKVLEVAMANKPAAEEIITNIETGSGGSGTVSSVNGMTGDVVLTKAHIGLNNVDNTSDTNKPISSATQTALNNKLNLAGGTMTGPLTLSGDPSTNLGAATKQYVDTSTSAATIIVQGTAYVAKNGNDLTGAVNQPSKPFLTIGAAISACNTAGYNTYLNPSMIFVAPGIYVENLTLLSNIGICTLSGTLDYTVTIQGAHVYNNTTGNTSSNQVNLIGLQLQNPTNPASTIAFTGTAGARMRIIDCSIDMGNNTGGNPTIYINNSGSGSPHISLWSRATQCGISKSAATGDAIQIVAGGLNSYGYDISSVSGNAINMSGGYFNIGYGTIGSTGQQAISASGGTGSISVAQVYNPTSNKDGILQSGTSVITCGVTNFNIAGTTGYCVRGTGTLVYDGLTFTGPSGNTRIQTSLTRVSIPVTPTFVV